MNTNNSMEYFQARMDEIKEKYASSDKGRAPFALPRASKIREWYGAEQAYNCDPPTSKLIGKNRCQRKTNCTKETT